MRALTIVLTKQVVLTEKTSSNIKKRTRTTECHLSSHTILRKIQRKGNKHLYICSYYNPKTSDSESMTEFETSVQRAAANNPCLLIGGDFNLPGWNWTNKTLHSGTQHAQQHYYFSDILDDHGLTQLVQEPTRNKNTFRSPDNKLSKQNIKN